MTPKIILCLALVAFNLSSQARLARLWSDAELMGASDLVVVGQPVKVKDLDETNSLGWDKSIGWSQLTFRGVETTFKVSAVLKGTSASDQIILHHYRFDKVIPLNAPTFVEFKPGDTNEYLLYLINDGTNRYAPTSGQIDPRLPIKPATDSATDTNSLRIRVIPSKTEVRVKDKFKVALRVANPTTTNQTVRVMSCSWDEEWKSSNTNISWPSWICTINYAVNVAIPPGGAYTNELEMLIPEPISEKTLSFRMGFTPIDSKNTFWSDEVRIAVISSNTSEKLSRSNQRLNDTKPLIPTAAEPLNVSLVQLIANPKDYDGKLVQVIGFVRLEFEGNAIYLHQDDHKHGIYKNGLWIDVTEDIRKRKVEFDQKHVLLEGTFNAKEAGHLGLWSGSIQQIRSFQVWNEP